MKKKNGDKSVNYSQSRAHTLAGRLRAIARAAADQGTCLNEILPAMPPDLHALAQPALRQLALSVEALSEISRSLDRYGGHGLREPNE